VFLDLKKNATSRHLWYFVFGEKRGRLRKKNLHYYDLDPFISHQERRKPQKP
jgi:hypothetical protein